MCVSQFMTRWPLFTCIHYVHGREWIHIIFYCKLPEQSHMQHGATHLVTTTLDVVLLTVTFPSSLITVFQKWRGTEGEGEYERKRFMHYDCKGAHTLMALNGLRVAARWVDEEGRTWWPPMEWWHFTTRPCMHMHTHTLTHIPLRTKPGQEVR